MIRICRILIAALAIPSVIAAVALAGESAHYRSHPQVRDSGGGKPASTNYQGRASIAQEVLGPSQSASYFFHAGYLYGAYGHMSPQTNKRMAISRLQVAKALIPHKEWKKVDDAIKHLEKSLTPLWWIDPWHLNEAKEEKKPKDEVDVDESMAPGDLTLVNKGGEGEPLILKKRYGQKVFDEEKKAAKKVRELSREKKFVPAAIALFVAAGWDIMDADSTLAQIKIVEAELSGGDPKELKKAREEMKKAEHEKVKDKKGPHYDHAVDHYKHAWEHAVKSQEKHGLSEHQQVAGLVDREAVFGLGAPYPNPARAGSSVRYGVGEKCSVSLKVYDVTGRLVRVLVDETKSPGFYECEWDLTDGAGAAVAAGTYIYRLEAGPFVGRNKVVILR
jgi:hypothetical protein